MSKALVINVNKCTGCELCIDVCSGTKTGDCSEKDSRIRVLRDEPTAVFIPIVCAQCQEHPCSEACPEEAIQYDSILSIYTVDHEKCTTCGLCEDACPNRGIFVDGDCAVKCDLCMGNPACVQICIPGALNWIEMSEEKQKVILYNKMEMIQTFNDAG
jgi:Fe-S-cluster-containing hydrogenase component 2